MSVKHSGKLFVISGPSGTGKGTICKRLVENSDMDLSISATTREPRPGEAEGENYFFLDRKTFCLIQIQCLRGKRFPLRNLKSYFLSGL